MSVTVTVHSGELKQIRQLIAGPIAKKKKYSHGQLYGLWTHSNQPVIQYVIGDPKDDKEVARILWENHALRHLGSWSTEEFEDDGTSNGKPPLSFVNMTVELLDNGKVMNVKLKVFEKESKLNGVLEMLEGHSAFRLQSPFSDQKDQKTVQERYHDHPQDDDLDVRDLSEKPSCQAETKEEQWYSSEDGMQLFGKIHGALQQQFEITGTSRDTKTHDLCVSLKLKGVEFAVEFPSNFPHDLAILTRAGNRKEEIHLTETRSEEKNGSKGKKTTGQDKKKADEERQAETSSEGKKSNGSKDKKTAHAGQVKEKNASDVEAQEHLDPEKIPQLLAQAIKRQVFGTQV